MTTPFNSNELEARGSYQHFGTYYGYPYSQIDILDSPITPRENWIRFVTGADYEWIPDCVADVYDITPDANPDTIACGFEGGIDTLGVEWVPCGNPDLPAMVKPGNPKLTDICDWREVLEFPDVDSWDWEAMREGYAASTTEGRFVRGVVYSGYFERLISLMDFEEAAVALIAEPEETLALFERLADLNIDIIEHYAEYLNVDGIMIHDDWASQTMPFFSEQAAREIVLPPYKRMVDRVHELGLLHTAHCCGCAIDRVPIMIEAGVDSWQLQPNAANPTLAAAKAGDKVKLEPAGFAPEASSYNDLVDFIVGEMEAAGPTAMYGAMDPITYDLTPELRRAIYQAGRIVAGEFRA